MTANNILYGKANMEARVGVCVPGLGVGGFEVTGVGGRRSIGDIAGEAMMLLSPTVEMAGTGDGAAIEGCENGCVGVR